MGKWAMRSIILLGVAIAVITSTVYWQVGGHEFLNFDDDAYVVENSRVATGLTAANVVWAFTSVYQANWHPVTWLSHMADVELFGLNPRGHHLTSVAIHVASTLLLLLLLFRLTGSAWRSACVAALFALHPLHVESVAWVAERKDVLSGFFWFLTLLLYAGYVRQRKPSLYLLTLLAFVLGLMTKPMLVTLPLVMLLLDFWPLDRFKPAAVTPGQPAWRCRCAALLPLVKEKFPFLVCSLLSSAITIYAQHHGGAIQTVDSLPLGLRLENAATAYVKYLSKTLWPADLGVYYPLPAAIPAWQVVGALLLLLAATAAVVRGGRSQPYLVTGWFWFLVTLVPVIGLVQVGRQALADRYTYLPLVGLFIMAAWGIPALVARLPYRQAVLGLLAGAALIGSTALTWRQLGYWRDSIALYRHTLLVTAGSPTVHYNLGLALADRGHFDEAISEYRKALGMDANFIMAYNNLGLAFAGRGDLDAAIGEFRKALAINPEHSMTRNNLGAAFIQRGDLDRAIVELNRVIGAEPDYVRAYNNLGIAFFRKGQIDEAVNQFRRALVVDPGFSEAQSNLKIAVERQNDINRLP
jgi:tetratricopeptide (TPR) repeat protein